MRKNVFILVCWMLFMLSSNNVIFADTRDYTGYIDATNTEESYDIRLKIGQGVVVTAEGFGELDTILYLLTIDGIEIAENDDRDNETHDSHLIYIAQETSTYTIVVTSYDDTSGDYRLTISIQDASTIVYPPRFILSGETTFHDTEHFRIHYTLEGDDAVAITYLKKLAQTIEEVYAIQIHQMGWPAPPDDGNFGGNALYDIYLRNVFDENGEGVLGYVSAEWPTADNLNTIPIEENAVASYMVMDNNYLYQDEEDPGTESDPATLMRATAAHEFHHSIQFGYDALDRNSWYYEATASWMETATFPSQQDATQYVDGVFMYPEICFGSEGPADPIDGFLMYGTWLFIDSLVKAHGEQILLRLWENIAQTEGWRALEDTLAEFGDTLPSAVARYHVQNLVRDYALADEFAESTVWLENTIKDPGEWTFTGRGIQELAANYFAFDLSGYYRVSVDTKDAALELWLILITGDNALVIPIGQEGVVDTSHADYAYVMAFNAEYDSDVTHCRNAAYTIDVVAHQPIMGDEPGAMFWFDATHFAPLTQILEEAGPRIPNIPRTIPAPIHRKPSVQSAR